jgi:hypothetical protein
MPITITTNDAALQAKLAAIVQGMSPQATDPLMESVAMKTLRALVMKTPKGFTGQTRRDWNVFRRAGAGGGYMVTNQSKVMFFLEKGTADHGPKEKKLLYIPLNRKAAVGGWNAQLKVGVDYILTKRVKGIKKMLIVAKQRPITAQWNYAIMRKHIKQLLTAN